MSNEKENLLKEQSNQLTEEQKELKEKLLEALNNKDVNLTSSLATYLNQLINLEISVLNNTVPSNELLALNKPELFAEIADYNFCNRPSKLIKDTLTKEENSPFKNLELNSTKQFYRGILEETFSLNFDGDIINLFKIYHDQNNCYGQEYLIDLHKIEANSNEINNLSGTEKLKISLANYVYNLLLQDFGMKNTNNINAKRNILSRYSVNTSIYGIEEVKTRVRTR